MSKRVYLDANGTTDISPKVANILTKWVNCAANPSSTSKFAAKSRQVIDAARRELIEHCNAKKYTLLYTSGATESNCTIIRSTVCAYNRIRKVKPTVVVSAIEHESIISCCESLVEDDMADVVYVKPNCEGSIPLLAIEQVIESGAPIALISVMFANNEIGTINNVQQIGALAHDNNIPFHCDAVQGFGKYQIDLERNNIDALSASFHKFYGPMGLGLLFIKNELIEGYQLHGMINGKQQDSLRGGTENVPAIAASSIALRDAFHNREYKNQKLANLRARLIDGLGKIYPIGSYPNHVMRAQTQEVDAYQIEFDKANNGFVPPRRGAEQHLEALPPVEIVIMGPPANKPSRYLPNTVLFSIVKNIFDKKGPFCNVKLRSDLDKMGFVVSIGSACNTASKDISHVLKALACPAVVGRGVIRVSLSDCTTAAEIDAFLEALKVCAARQICGAPKNIKPKPKPKKKNSNSKPQPKPKPSKVNDTTKRRGRPRKNPSE